MVCNLWCVVLRHEGRGLYCFRRKRKSGTAAATSCILRSLLLLSPDVGLGFSVEITEDLPQFYNLFDLSNHAF